MSQCRRTWSRLSVLPITAVVVISIIASAQQPVGNATPEEARRYFVQANTLFKSAQSIDDYTQAAALYKQALDLAPHFGDAWYNLAKVQEKLEQYDDAIASLKHFLADSPNDPEARAAQDHIYELEALKKKAASDETRRQIWTDPATGLVWSREGSGDLSWREAVNYCRNLRLDGHSDWRLPAISELQAIYDPKGDIPFVKGPLKIEFYIWSSSLGDNSGEALFLDFNGGAWFPWPIGEKFAGAVCVRHPGR
jgi:tetratricopeptide (TPR) repeat protein